MNGRFLTGISFIVQSHDSKESATVELAVKIRRHRETWFLPYVS